MKRLLLAVLLLLLPGVVWATVTTTTARVAYTANGVQTVFPYPFRTLANSDLRVIINGVVKTLTTDYTVSGVGAPTGGNVTFLAAPASGAAVVIERNVPATQLTDYVENAPFSAETLERNLDKLTMLVQQVANGLVTPPVGFPPMGLPAPGAGECLAWNAPGTFLQTLPCGLSTITITGSSILGDSLAFPIGNTNKPGIIWELAAGTNAAPVTTLGSVFKISKTSNYTSPFPGCGMGVAGEIDPWCGSALTVLNRGLSTSQMMTTGMAVGAWSDAANIGQGEGDAVALLAFGQKAAGTGTAFGAYLEGRRDAAGSGVVAGGILAFGAEVRQTNETATDCLVDPNGGIPTCANLWLTGGSSSGKLKGVGVQVFDVDGFPGKYQSGFRCSSQSLGAHGGGCFEDFSDGTYGLRIAGNHTNGIHLFSGVYSGPAVLMKDTQAITWANTGNTQFANLGVTTAANGATAVFSANQGTNMLLRLTSPSGSRALANLAGELYFTDVNGTASGLVVGAAGGKRVVCIDNATGRLHASSTGTDCSN